jgi:hypothetical protein
MVLANERGWREESERGAEPAARSLKARPLARPDSRLGSASCSLTHAQLHREFCSFKSRFQSYSPKERLPTDCASRASPSPLPLSSPTPIASASLAAHQHRVAGPPKETACIAHHARCCCCCAGTAGNRSFLWSSSSAVRIHASLLSSVSPYDKARSLRRGTPTPLISELNHRGGRPRQTAGERKRTWQPSSGRAGRPASSLHRPETPAGARQSRFGSPGNERAYE